MAARAVTITLDPSPPLLNLPHHFHSSVNDLLRASVKDIETGSRIIETHCANLDPRTRGVTHAHNGLIMTVLDAYKWRLHLVLHPDDIGTAVRIQLHAMSWARDEPFLRDFRMTTYLVRETIDRVDHPYYRNVAAAVKPWVGDTFHDGSYVPPSPSKVFQHALETGGRPPAPSDFGTTNSLFGHGGPIPSVTLLGTSTDWANAFSKIQKKAEEDKHDMSYVSKVAELFQNFERSFAEPASPEVIDFWKNMCPGPSLVRGWLALFNVFDPSGAPNESRDNCLIKCNPNIGVHVGAITENRVSPGYRLLHIEVDDAPPKDLVFKLAVGTIGTQFWSSKPYGHGRWDTVRPLNVWGLYKEDP